MSEFDTHGYSQEFISARQYDSLYAEILLRCGLFEKDMVPGGDETELRELVGMFLSSRAGMEPERAQEAAENIVQYYDGYAGHRLNGDVALAVVPTIFSRAVIEAGLAGEHETVSNLLNTNHHAGLTSPLNAFASNIQQDIDREVKVMIGARLMAAAESLSVRKGHMLSEPRMHFKLIVGRLTDRYLLEIPQSRRLIRYADTGRMQYLPFRLFDKR